MHDPSPSRAFRLAAAASRSDPQAAEELLPVLYDELRALAASYMAQLSPGQTLQPTALVHEAYLRLIGNGDPGWEGRRHFFGAAARAMRQVLVDDARRKNAIKRGGGRTRVAIEGVALAGGARAEDLIALDEAFSFLEARDEIAARVAHLKLFVGFTTAETADLLGLSTRTVEREWAFARSVLADLLRTARGGEER
jgi:RNA polymerase sigma factor (TIGR02999 family)